MLCIPDHVGHDLFNTIEEGAEHRQNTDNVKKKFQCVPYSDACSWYLSALMTTSLKTPIVVRGNVERTAFSTAEAKEVFRLAAICVAVSTSSWPFAQLGIPQQAKTRTFLHPDPSKTYRKIPFSHYDGGRP